MDDPKNQPGIDKIAGTQSISRAFLVLKVLALVGTRGISLSTMAKSTRLTTATAHRILQQLIQQRAAVQRKNSDYELGPLMSELSISSFPRQKIIAACRPALAALASATQDTVFLIWQSGGDSICLDRIEATGIVRVITLEVGERRPLADSAAGIAILAQLNDAEMAILLAQATTTEARYPNDTESIMQRIQKCRGVGHAFVQRADAGISAIGMVVAVPHIGLAISVSSTSARLDEPRGSRVAAALRGAVTDAAKRLSSQAI